MFADARLSHRQIGKHLLNINTVEAIMLVTKFAGHRNFAFFI